MEFAIYKIVNTIKNKIYIGQTSRSIEERWKEHLYMANNAERKGRSYLHNAIAEHGADAFSIELLHKVDSIEKANALEISLIAELNSVDRDTGYNIKLGGDNYSMPQEIKDKISAGHKGKVLSSKTKEKLRQCNLGKKQSQETREKRKISNKASASTDEFKEKISALVKSRLTDEVKAEYSKKCKHKKPISDHNGVRYESISDAAKKLNLKVGSISDMLCGRIKSTKGYMFKYV